MWIRLLWLIEPFPFAYDNSVSSRHAVINYENGFLTVTDVGSKNGTYVNGERIPVDVATQLARGTELKMGRVKIVVDDFKDAGNMFGIGSVDSTEFLVDDASDI